MEVIKHVNQQKVQLHHRPQNIRSHQHTVEKFNSLRPLKNINKKQNPDAPGLPLV